MRKILIIFLVCFVLTGCYRATFIEGNSSRGIEHDKWMHFFFWGLVGEKAYYVSEFCPGGASKVATGANFGTGIVTFLTLGIYAPRKVYITCKDETYGLLGYEIYLNREGKPVYLKKEIGNKSYEGNVFLIASDIGKYGAILDGK